MVEKPEAFDLHHAVGGTAAWRRLAEAFYSRVDRDPRLRPLFPGKTHRCAIEALTAFLVQLFGGPSSDTQHRWWLSLQESHLRFRIGQRERTAWMENMVRALEDARVDEPLRGHLREFFEQSSAYLVNSGETPSAAPSSSKALAGDAVRCEMARRWEGQRKLDEAVGAIRGDDGERAIALAESSILRIRLEREPSVMAGLLAQMAGSRYVAIRQYVEQKITADPALVRERYAGRTLLHEAAARGNVSLVELLIRLSADPNAQDGGGHTPLYSVANECPFAEGGAVVHALVKSGADIHANDGVKHCTALHMAARRGHTGIAAALLDCGAAVDARDSVGDTPLRRAVNCGKVEVASLLLARGADAHSKGSKGLTPLLAARTIAMKQMLLSQLACGT